MSPVSIWKNRYCYFLVFLLIYLEWGYGPVIAQNISGTIKTALMIIGILPLLFFGSFKLIRRYVILFSYLTFIVIFSALRDAQIGNSVLLFVPILCAFIITSAYPVEIIINVFCNIITFLAAYSIIVYVIAWITPSVIISFPVLPNAYHIPIHDLGLAVMPSGVNVVRNYGITWEPGAFALLLCLAIYGQIVGYNDLNKPKIIINTLALISTLSTMGFVVLAAIILVTQFRTKPKSISKYTFLMSLLFIGAVFLLVLSSTEIYEVVFGKLNGFSLGNHNTETTQARINAIIYPGIAFLSSPLYGVGYDSFNIINKTLCNSVATNTIVNWFAIYGIAMGFPCTYYYSKSILRASDYLKLNIVFKILLFIAFVLLISTESLLRISLIYVIIFYGCSSKKLIKHA